DRGLHRLTTRAKEGRDAVRSPQTHPQTRSVATTRSLRRPRRVPPRRHGAESTETGQTDSRPGANDGYMRLKTLINPRVDHPRTRPKPVRGRVLQHNPP